MPPLVASDIAQDLILFDGDCVLCSRAAHFVHVHDRAARFKFVAIQSPYGRILAQRFGIDPDVPISNLAVIEGWVFFKSDAALQVLLATRTWRWLTLFRWAPRPLRNWVYDRIARNRHAWWGRRAQCWVGDPALRERIIEQAP